MTEIPLHSIIPNYEILRSVIDDTAMAVYLVGGAVRDFILGRVSPDFDFIVFGDPERFARELAARLGGRPVVLDDRERIYRVVSGGIEYDFSLPKGKDLPSDLAHRDFTINACAADASTSPAPIVGAAGSQNDIEIGIVRAVSDGAFIDDPVRLIRAFRFSSVLGFPIDRKTRDLIGLYRNLIQRSARERIRDEWVKLLEASGSCTAITAMDETGLLGSIFPEMATMKGVDQNRWHTEDVWGHCLSTMGHVQAIIDDPDRFFPGQGGEIARYLDEPMGGGWQRGSLLKFVALVHDIGKPDTRVVKEDGQAAFYGHENVGAEIFMRTARGILLGKKAARFGRVLIKNHMRLLSLSISETVTRRAVARLYRDTGDTVIALLILGLADTLAGKSDPDRVKESGRVIDEVLRIIDEIRNTVIPLLSGTEIMKLCGIPEGELVGRLKARLSEAQAMRVVTSKTQARAFVREEMKRRATIA